MQYTHDEAVDLNLLEPLRALLEERHVTRAAKRCRLSQPAMSRALERLRVMFGDDLLVRTGGVYERTSRGERLLAEMQDLLPRIHTAIRGERFDPIASKSRFTIATTDFAGTLLIPMLLERLRALAPQTRLDVVAWDDRSLQDVESGRIDIAVIGLREPFDLEREDLFTDEFVCIVAKDHPLSGRRVTLKQFVAYPHVSLAIKNGRQPWIDDSLEKLGVERRVMFRTPYQLAATLVAASSDFIFTAAGRLAPYFTRIANVKVLQAPKELAQIRYGMAWHRRLRDDVAQAWLRGIIREIAASL
jgi:DNA-binding transcriptional LysR family regulator